MEKNDEENIKFKKDQENEIFPLSVNDRNNDKNINKVNKNINAKRDYFIFYFWTFILLFTLLYFMIDTITNDKKKKTHNFLIENTNKKIIEYKKEEKIDKKPKEIKYRRAIDEKIGIAFVYISMFGNGIGRMISLLTNELVKIEDKYEIYLISNPKYNLDFYLDDRIIRLPIIENRTLIEEFDKKSNVIYYILNNVLALEEINFYKSFNKKVINIMHGAYLANLYANISWVYKEWQNNLLFDAFIQVVPDDYYAYKKLGMKNTFFIPNLYTFNPSETPNSNLTYNHLMIMGRENDKIKGGIYAIQAMSLIVKEIPDAKLYFISSDYRIKFIEDLVQELNLTNNIEIINYVDNITEYYLNTSVLLCPSISESFPMVMNEGKAFGVPIVAFNVSYCPSYQKGVILVDMLNVEQMAKEAIKLLKDYNYRKTKGIEGKKSLENYSNSETVNKWDRLFSILNKDDSVAYKKLQEYTYDKYYDEEKAKERLESSYNFGIKYNKFFECHCFNDMINFIYLNHLEECKNEDILK